MRSVHALSAVVWKPLLGSTYLKLKLQLLNTCSIYTLNSRLKVTADILLREEQMVSAQADQY